ncbi:MAG: hypothetical protein SPD81_12215 [Candidatus Faecousia sp.]|nr:hypothetical protein [Candidatus Faecousia sp.]
MPNDLLQFCRVRSVWIFCSKRPPGREFPKTEGFFSAGNTPAKTERFFSKPKKAKEKEKEKENENEKDI